MNLRDWYELLCRKGLASRRDLGGEDFEIPSTGVAHRSQDPRFAKPDPSELLEEGAAFLGSGDSGEPVRQTGPFVFGKGLDENEFRNEDLPVGTNDPRKLAEDRVPGRVEVENPVDDRYVHRPIRQRECFRVRGSELDVCHAGLSRGAASTIQHGRAEIDADDLSVGPYASRCYQGVEPSPAAKIQNHRPGRDGREDRDIRDPGEGFGARIG